MQIQKPSFTTCSPVPSAEKGYVLVLDIGTTGIKAFVFDSQLQIVSKAYQKIFKFRPKRGWVEQDPCEIVQSAKVVMKRSIRESKIAASSILGVGITNQRESTLAWDQKTGRPIYPVIGWEDTRTRTQCNKRKDQYQAIFGSLTGLTLDAYFSASKMEWILEHVSKATTLLRQNRLRFGTIDSWILSQLCEGQSHLTDETNAARTLLFDIKRCVWSEELCNIFSVPMNVLPHVQYSRSCFGYLSKQILGVRLPIMAVCGDQQASTYAALCTLKNQSLHATKITYGTGVFIVQVLGRRFALHPPFFTTLVPAIGGETCYALEGKIEGSGEMVDRLLSDLPKLFVYFQKLSVRVQKSLAYLPYTPSNIVVDGGIARDGSLVEILEKKTGIPACLQNPYDGTALGCALLTFESANTHKDL